MKNQLKGMILLTLLFTCHVSLASLYVIPKNMVYFKPYKGKWTEIHHAKGEKIKEHTEANFSHRHDIFNIRKVLDFEKMQIAGDVESLTITNQRNHHCDAVLYRNRQSYYFSGKPDEKSKVLVMKNKDSQNKIEKYLIIDFSGCPAKPPSYKLSDLKP